LQPKKALAAPRELRACRMGKQIRIRHADLLAYEHGQTITPECPA
jgi:hypothetical protein